MMVSSSAWTVGAAALLSLSLFQSAGASPANAVCSPKTVEAYTYEACYTERVSKKPRKPIHYTTYTRTISVTRDAHVTVTPVGTITPAAKTVTQTASTTITADDHVPQVTEYTYPVTTITESVTETLPTSTITETTTTNTVVSSAAGPTVVPTPDGFIGVLDSLPNSNAKRNVAAMREADLVQRSLEHGSLPALCKEPHKKQPKSYPAAVLCYELVELVSHETVTRTAATTHYVTAARPTTTVSITSTDTTTQTFTTPDALRASAITEYDTITVTVTPSTTTTETSTITATQPSYSPTSYAMCQPSANNIAGGTGGNGIVTVGPYGASDPTSTYFTSDADAQSCCVSCAITAECAFSAFYPGFPSGQQCYIGFDLTGTCKAGQNTNTLEAEVYQNDGLGTDQGYFVSNGACGIINAVSPSNG